LSFHPESALFARFGVQTLAELCVDPWGRVDAPHSQYCSGLGGPSACKSRYKKIKCA